MAQMANDSLGDLIKSGKLKEFTQLVKDGVSSSVLNEQDNHGRSALHYCVLNDLGKHCQLLIDKGANANLQDAQGYTALHLAVTKSDQSNEPCSMDCANKLSLCSNYDWTIRDSLGRTVLHSMLISNQTKLFVNIIDTIFSNKKSDNDSNENKSAENKENEKNEQSESLTKSFNLQSKSGQTIMHLAVSLKQENIVSLLLNLLSQNENLIDLTVKDNDNRLAIDCNSINNGQNSLLSHDLSQLLEQQTVLQMGQKEKQRIENEKIKSQTQFKSKTVGGNTNKNKKKKMKIKLKK